MPGESHPWDSNWTLIERLGKGGQGVTHLVTAIDSPCQRGALKTLKNNQDLQARGRMHREVASLQVLSTAGGAVPEVLDHNTEQYSDKSVELFVVMEYIPGRTLREVVDTQGPFSLDAAVQTVVCICNTIELAHTFPILHRDIKPENIIARNTDGTDIVIVDYGLSFNAGGPEVTETEETFRNRFLDLPETNTPGGNRRDPRSDVTAACAIFYYLLTGHTPGQLQDGDGRLPHLRPACSLLAALGQKPYIGQLEVLFNRGFAPNINNRFQTVVEFRERISMLTTSAASTQPEDPAVVAERASAMLRQYDRTTQIRDFEPSADKLLQSLFEFTSKFASKLGRFNLLLNKTQFVEQTWPAGLDRVSPLELRVHLNPQHHNLSRIVTYAIGSRGEQCVIVRQKLGSNRGDHQIKVLDEHKELLWYDASVAPGLELIERDIQQWLNGAMQELTDMVVTE